MSTQFCHLHRWVKLNFPLKLMGFIVLFNWFNFSQPMSQKPNLATGIKSNDNFVDRVTTTGSVVQEDLFIDHTSNLSLFQVENQPSSARSRTCWSTTRWWRPAWWRSSPSSAAASGSAPSTALSTCLACSLAPISSAG